MCTLHWNISLDVTISHKCNWFIVSLPSSQANKCKAKRLLKCHLCGSVTRRSSVLTTWYFLLCDFFSSDKWKTSALKGLIWRQENNADFSSSFYPFVLVYHPVLKLLLFQCKNAGCKETMTAMGNCMMFSSIFISPSPVLCPGIWTGAVSSQPHRAKSGGFWSPLKIPFSQGDSWSLVSDVLNVSLWPKAAPAALWELNTTHTNSTLLGCFQVHLNITV